MVLFCNKTIMTVFTLKGTSNFRLVSFCSSAVVFLQEIAACLYCGSVQQLAKNHICQVFFHPWILPATGGGEQHSGEVLPAAGQVLQREGGRDEDDLQEHARDQVLDQVRGEAEGDVRGWHEVREASESVLRRHRMSVRFR